MTEMRRKKVKTYYTVNTDKPGKIVGECVTNSRGIFRLKITDPKNMLLLTKDGYNTSAGSISEGRYGMTPKDNEGPTIKIVEPKK